MTTEEQLAYKSLECERDVARKDVVILEVEIARLSAELGKAQAERAGFKWAAEALQREQRELAA